MTDFIKKTLRPFIPQWVLNIFKKQTSESEVEEWKRNGSKGPAPHIVKQRTIAEYQVRFDYGTLIETGTYLGDMVEAQKKRFNKIISIELGIDLHKKATKRFISDPHITIVQGDSGKVLPEILKGIKEPAIFWLDGHYSAGITAKGDTECPIYEELTAVLSNPNINHIILIDDARCFIGEGDYPSIEKLTEFVKKIRSNYQLEVKDDIIRYVAVNV